MDHAFFEPGARPLSWENWSGGVRCRPRRIVYPATADEIRACLRESAEAGEPVRVVGAGHAFTPLVATEGTIVSLDNYAGIAGLDPAHRAATVLGGTRLRALGPLLWRHGLAQANLGDLDAQSIAGALATGTHGTGARLGGLATQLRGLTLYTADGEAIACSESESADVFQAGRVSLGALGLVGQVTLECLPAYKLREVKGTASLAEVLNNHERLKGTHRHFEFCWFPHTDRVATRTLDATDGPVTPQPLSQWVAEVLLENGACWALSEACKAMPALCGPISRLQASAVSTGVRSGPSYDVFATPRLVKFEEMEYALPAASLPAVLEEMRAWIAREQYPVNFPIEVRFGARDDVWLSPAYGRETAYVAVQMYKGMPFQAYFGAMETIFRKHRGRPHWGRRHTCTAREFAELYPRWDDFQRVRRALDPQGRFMNAHLRRLFNPDA